MPEWRAQYAFEVGSPLVVFSGRTHAWRDLPPAGLVRVILTHGPYTHTLAGMDNTWMTDDGFMYGMFNDPRNHAWYQGAQAIAFAWPAPDAHVQIVNPDPPAGVHVIAGIMLPDWFAREVGLLGPNDSSPPRPESDD